MWVLCMSFIHNNGGYKYISEMNGRKTKHILALGKITKEQAEQKLKEFQRQLEIKPIYRTIIIDPPWYIEKIKREVAPNRQHKSL